MLNSKWLDIAIGVVFVWFLLSIVVSVVNESINRVLSVRSKQLWMALSQMLDGKDELKPLWKQWLRVPFYRGRPEDPATAAADRQALARAEQAAIDAAPEPQRSALAAAEVAVQAAQDALAAAAASGLPAPHQGVALQADLIAARKRRDLARQAALDAAPEAQRAAVAEARGKLSYSRAIYATQAIQATENHKSPTRKTKIHNLPSSVFTQALIELGVEEPTESQRSIDDYLKGLPPPVGPQLRSIWATSNRNIVEFRKQAEEWFDGQMARVSSMYRSQARIVMALLGAGVAVLGFGLGLRTDTLGLVSDLQRDANLRAAFADLGTQVSERDLQALSDVGCPTTTTAANATPSLTCVARGLETYENIDLIFDDRGSVTPSDDSSVGSWLRNLWGNLGDLWTWRRILGVVITAAALSFGASFWYNVLRRLVGLRQGGKSAPSA